MSKVTHTANQLPRTHQEDTGLARVGDPHLGSVEGVVGAVLALGGSGLHGESIRPGRGLGQAEGSQGVSGEAGEVLVHQGRVGVFAQDSVNEGVVHITQHRNRGINLGELYSFDK